ncbi:MAG: M13 family metallopeptidase [Candidatus Kapabacteria bacterium]|nr:M13 family metallopeptidase [Candidatus Kapabacteria bacterium]
MNNIVRFMIFILASAAFVSLNSCSKEETTKAEEEMAVKAVDSANFDFNIHPGDDFFKYVSGGWMTNNPIPESESRWGAFAILNLENQTKLRTLFEEAASGKHKEKDWVKIGDFYSSGMDTVAIEKAGIEPLKPLFEKIDKIASVQDLQTTIGELSSYSIQPIFYFYVSADDKNSTMNIAGLYQGGLGLPDRDYYFPKDDRTKNILSEYKKHLGKVFEIYGLESTEAKKASDVILKIETEIAKASSTKLELRDPVKNYNKMQIQDLQKSSPNFDWSLYFKNLGIDSPTEINVGQPKFYKTVSNLMKKTSIEDWKTFLKWKVIKDASPYLNEAYVNQNFEFYGKVLTGSKVNQDRWKRVLNATSGSLGESVGKIYSEKYFPAKSKEKMLDLVDNLKIALKEHIQNLSWMGEDTKAKALVKLEKINVKIGYPDKWKDYSKVDVSRDNYVMNVLNASKFEMDEMLAKIGKPVDRSEWHMTPQTVNAYYSPNMNEIVFPAAILQPPFFYPDGDDAVNYGAIGVVIGHEMTHGFDDQGRQFDAEGNLVEWWTKEDADKFNEKVKVLVDQANSFVVINDMKVDGALTLGENIADLGGVTVSLTALKKALKGNVETPAIDGFTPLQRFFISYSQVWRQNIREEEEMRRLKEDVHSPGVYRVNGTLPNVPEFYKAFNITEANKLYMPVEKRAIIW